MAATGKMARRLPVVVILGATGTGKSKLALEMAQKFRGEIISADSMQVYQGLDIVTNKVTLAERALVPHHMIDYVSPLQTRHTVVDFRNKALPIIDAILSRDRIPIIVGGTNYYIEALLWDLLVDKKKTSRQRSPADSVASHSGGNPNQPHMFPAPTPGGSTPSDAPPDGAGKNEESQKSSASGLKEDSEEVLAPSNILRGDFEGVATPELYDELVKVDPVSSKRIHPNDRRKIVRALEVYRDEGRPLSDFLEEQHGAPGGGGVSGPLRYGLTTVIWIQCEQQVLDERTDKRVDQMIAAGLVDELSEFHDHYNQARLKENKEADYTLGIFQSIGFKEFHHYLLLSKDDRETDKGKAFFKLGVDEMKRTTRRYARKQHTWVTNRFLKRRGSEVPPVFAVSSTFPDRWQHDAHDPAAKVIEAVIEGLPPPIAPLPCEENTNRQEYNRCDVCDRVFVTTKEWTAHLKGRRHRNMLKRKARAEGGENRNKVRKDKHGDTTTTEPADPT